MQKVSECELVLFYRAAAVRARPPAGRARPSPLHVKKASASKWYTNGIRKSAPYQRQEARKKGVFPSLGHKVQAGRPYVRM
jgi:hypothetical protein